LAMRAVHADRQRHVGENDAAEEDSQTPACRVPVQLRCGPQLELDLMHALLPEETLTRWVELEAFDHRHERDLAFVRHGMQAVLFERFVFGRLIGEDTFRDALHFRYRLRRVWWRVRPPL